MDRFEVIDGDMGNGAGSLLIDFLGKMLYSTDAGRQDRHSRYLDKKV